MNRKISTLRQDILDLQVWAGIPDDSWRPGRVSVGIAKQKLIHRERRLKHLERKQTADFLIGIIPPFPIYEPSYKAQLAHSAQMAAYAQASQNAMYGKYGPAAGLYWGI